MKSSKKEIIFVAILMFIMGLVFTYPLILHFNSAIPYAHFSDGYIPVLKTGDHIQLYYWFWLLTDNFFGESSLFSNPYEFNMIGKQAPQRFAMFPFSLLFLIFKPFGNIFAYNATVILSFVLAGIFMYLLVKFYTESKTAALFSTLIFTLAPFRLSQLFGSHINGFIFFFFPLIFYLLEVALQRYSVLHSIFAGIFIFILSSLEPHLIYYLFILLGIYIPVRLLLLAIKQKESESSSLSANFPQWLNRSPIIFLLILAGAGITLVFFSKMIIITQDHTIPFINKELLYSLLIYPILFVFLGVFFTTFFYLLTPLKINQAFAITVLSYAPIYLLSLYFIKLIYDIPKLGMLLIVLSLVMTFTLKIFFLFKYGKETVRSFFNYSDVDFKKKIIPVALILCFMALSLIYIFNIKANLFTGSTVQAGRTFHEIGLYSPKIEDIFRRINPFSERYVYLGIIPLILCMSIPGIIMFKILKGSPSNFNEKVKLVFLSFFALIFILSYTLSLGLSFRELSLYKLFYYYFPYFNYPRSPSRMLIVSFFALSILAGYTVKEFQIRLMRINREKLFIGVSILLAVGLLVDYYSFRPIGITKLNEKNEVYEYVKNNIGDKILLEVPLWPGDSHQSSLYEYYITLDQVRRVNGYRPVVSNEYIETIFKPLRSLNSGRIDEEQYNLLNNLNVKYITIHNNRDVFPAKVSPYPPLFTVRQFMNSPFVDFIRRDKSISLFKVKEKPFLISEDETRFSGSLIVSNVYGAERLRHGTGTVVLDEQIDNQVIWGNAEKDQEGFLAFGPYVSYPRGKYLAYFRLKVSNNKGTEPVATIQATHPHHGEQRVLAKREIKGIDFSEAGRYQDFYLYFDLAEQTRLEFRTYFSKKTDVWVERVVVSSDDQKHSDSYFEAEELLGNTGDVIIDHLASGEKAIFADSKAHSLDYLIYGPHRKYQSGSYRAFYRMKIDQSNIMEKGIDLKDIATIDVTSDSNRHILASRSLNSNDFKSGDYHLIPLDFNLDRGNELSFRVRFNKKINIWVDRVEIINLNKYSSLIINVDENDS